MLESSAFYRDANAYFTGVWRQAETTEPPGQTTILNALACDEAALSVEEIALATGLTNTQVEAALVSLERHDVVKLNEQGWQISMGGLMRRWILRKSS